MKATAYLVFILTLICAISSGLLAAVYKLTAEPIKTALELRTAGAAARVMPEGLEAPGRTVVNGETIFVARREGRVAAVALEGRSGNGYGGEIVLMVGLDTSGKLVGYHMLVASETPGLGTKITEDSFLGQLRGRAFTANWQVRKDGGEIDAITAATISSRAALECVRDAIEKYEKAAAALEVK